MQRNSLVAAAVVPMNHCVPMVLRCATKSQVRPLIIERIMIDVIHVLLAVHGSGDQPVHDYRYRDALLPNSVSVYPDSIIAGPVGALTGMPAPLRKPGVILIIYE